MRRDSLIPASTRKTHDALAGASSPAKLPQATPRQSTGPLMTPFEQKKVAAVKAPLNRT